jgi:hypothetical protein
MQYTKCALLLIASSHTTVFQIRSVCLWECYTLQQHGIYGFKSVLSNRYLGLDMFSNVQCKASQFKSWEQWQCEINIQQQQQLTDNTSSAINTAATETTRLIACSGNWNNGGYMICDSNGRISIGTTSQQHKAIAAVFDIVDSSNLQYSPYAAGGALHLHQHV